MPWSKTRTLIRGKRQCAILGVTEKVSQMEVGIDPPIYRASFNLANNARCADLTSFRAVGRRSGRQAIKRCF